MSVMHAETVGFSRVARDEGLQTKATVRPEPLENAEDAEIAAYLLDLTIAARRMAMARGFEFLAYLVGVAAEEARMLSLGKSAVKKKE